VRCQATLYGLGRFAGTMQLGHGDPSCSVSPRCAESEIGRHDCAEWVRRHCARRDESDFRQSGGPVLRQRPSSNTRWSGLAGDADPSGVSARPEGHTRPVSRCGRSCSVVVHAFPQMKSLRLAPIRNVESNHAGMTLRS